MMEYGIAQLQEQMERGDSTARTITQAYLQRIAEIDRAGAMLNAVIEVNPEALDVAGRLDRERVESGPRGPLHGIPILLKDNIDTRDRMQTTAGFLALAGHIADRDATVAAKLRVAGAVILGKTNLSEWANFRSDHSTSGWSSRGGQTRNPYALDRNPCGSSSGSAVRCRGEPVRRSRGHRDRRLHHLPQPDVWHRRDQANPGAGQSRGYHPHRSQPGHGRPHGAHRRRRSAAARNPRRP